MNKYYSPNESQMRTAGESLEGYHQQRDALIGRKADHLKPPASYGRGAVRRFEQRSKRNRMPWWLRSALHGLAVVLLLIAFFAACLIIAEVIQ
jgi:hypothetical protein